MLLCPLWSVSPHFLIFPYSAKGKSHFKRSEKSTHLLAPCDHNCAGRRINRLFQAFFDKKTSRPTDVDSSCFPPIDHVSLSLILHGG